MSGRESAESGQKPLLSLRNINMTFGGVKAGLMSFPAAGYAGRIVVVDIGITDELERIRRRDLALP